MIRHKLLLAVVAAIVMSVASPAFAAPKWLRADTHNFIIYSSGDRKQLQQFATQVEQFDALLRLRTNIPREEEPNRLTIFMLAQAGDVARIMGDKKGMIAGVYLPRADGSFAVANRERANSQYELSGNTVLFHEYAHHFMFHYYNAPYPSWYIEGFAEFISTAKIQTNGEWEIGRPPYYRAYGLLVTQKVPIEKLLFEVASKTDPAAGDAYYGRSWLLVHMLMMDPAWSGKLSEYFKLVFDGERPRTAAETVFGDLKALDKALDKYLDRSNVSALSSKRAVTVDGAITITELDPVLSQLTALSLKRRVESDLVKTRDALRTLAAQAPGNAEVWYELALAEQQIGEGAEQDADKEAARKLTADAVDRALASNPDHVRANVLKARMAFARLDAAGDFSAAAWREAREFLIRANAKAHLDPEPLAAWYESFQIQRREPTKNARDGLALAFNLAPEVPQYRAMYALDLARQKQFDAAIRLVEILAYDPHGDGQGRSLLAQLERMRDKDGSVVKVPAS
jgi:hypothetical protein